MVLQEHPVLKPISASQINAYVQCPRRWFHESVLGQRQPPTPAMLRGTKLHSILEDYLKHGTWATQPADLVALAKKGLPYLPPPGAATIEGKFTTDFYGITYTGFIDLHHRRDGVLTLQDHKTSSNPERYGLRSHADYLSDPQAVLYARFLLSTHPGDAGIRVGWVYYATKGAPRASTSVAYLSRAEVESAFATVVHKPASEMIAIREKGLTAADIPIQDGCYSYGQPCPYCTGIGDTTMSSFDDFFNTSTPAPVATPKAETPAAPPQRDIFTDLESKAEEAPKAPKAKAKKDPVNPPEKPAGVGLEPQGIGTPVAPSADVAVALKGIPAKDILLSIADLLTKVANTI